MVRGRRRQHLLLADENLISFVGQGDAEAFTTLYDRHSHPAFIARFLLPYPILGSPQASAATPKEVEGGLLRATTAGKSSKRGRRGGRPSNKEAHPSP